MNVLLLILGIVFLGLGFKILSSKKDIVNKPNIKSISKKGSSTLFDQILNDDFRDGK